MILLSIENVLSEPILAYRCLQFAELIYQEFFPDYNVGLNPQNVLSNTQGRYIV